jgi:hypothetical protein
MSQKLLNKNWIDLFRKIGDFILIIPDSRGSPLIRSAKVWIEIIIRNRSQNRDDTCLKRHRIKILWISSRNRRFYSHYARLARFSTLQIREGLDRKKLFGIMSQTSLNKNWIGLLRKFTRNRQIYSRYTRPARISWVVICAVLSKLRSQFFVWKRRTFCSIVTGIIRIKITDFS